MNYPPLHQSNSCICTLDPSVSNIPTITPPTVSFSPISLSSSHRWVVLVNKLHTVIFPEIYLQGSCHHFHGASPTTLLSHTHPDTPQSPSCALFVSVALITKLQPLNLVVIHPSAHWLSHSLVFNMIVCVDFYSR